jgi:uncharacterized membrane protein/GT2 family glycosyltransferase
MPRKKIPFMSVVVISYNGEATIERTLTSLVAQTYAAKKFEIIVVDDGSNDQTGKIVRNFGEKVTYLPLGKNKGISAARNAGLTIAKGEIYVACDDDCVVKPDWLSQLAKGYALDNPVGVGGYLSEIEFTPGIVKRYISTVGCGFPSAAPKKTATGSHQHPFKRLWNYLVSGLHRLDRTSDTHIEVSELYGANATFPVKVLRAVGGWRKHMSGIEDRDISLRIRQKFPDGHFYAMKDAIIMHDPAMSFWQFLKRPYRRGPVNFRFHRTNNMVPPLFPFPLLFVLLSTVTAFFDYRFLPLTLLIVPQILYFWWPFLALKKRRSIYGVFAYVQLAEESAGMVGLLKGYLTNVQNVYIVLLKKFFRISTLVALCVTATWVYVTLYSDSTLVRSCFSIPFLALMPGYFAFRAIAGYHKAESKMKIMSYGLGVSLIILMVTGLGVNQLLPLVSHNQQPLTTPILTTAIAAMTAVSILAASVRTRVSQKRRTLRSIWKRVLKTLPIVLPSLLLPVLAVGGAITLNNGGSNWLALTTFGLVGLFFFVLAWKNKHVAKGYPIALYGICAALLLGTSMRGWNITGHDIMQEFQVFQLTLQHAAWHMEYYQDAYNACLSITILPTIFQRLTGIADPYVFKFIFQLFFAMIAPIIYITLREHVSKKIALLAAFTFITFPTFLTDITMLNRQEIALLCLALALQVGLDKKLSRIPKSVLVFVLLIGMILSHYSTSYIAIGVLLGTMGLGVLFFASARTWRAMLRTVFKRTKAKQHLVGPLIFGPVVVLLTALTIFSWGTLITHTSGNISQTLTGLASNVPGILDKFQVPSLQSAHPTGTVLGRYLHATEQTRTLPTADYYPAKVVAASPVAATSETISPEVSWLNRLHVPVARLTSVFDATRSVYAILIEGLIGVGLLLMILKRVHTKLPRQYILVGVASLLIIGLQVVLPSGVINYGILRVIQQSLIFLSLPIILACFWLLGLVRIPEIGRARIVAAALVLFFLILSGFVPALTGGFKPTLALSNSGLYYEAYYTHQDEITADKWLLANSPKGSRVYSDEFARRKMITYSDSKIFPQPVLVPVGIPIDSYVYLSNGNTTFNNVPLYYNGDVASHTVPYDFLNSNKNLLYNSGHVSIYK